MVDVLMFDDRGKLLSQRAARSVKEARLIGQVQFRAGVAAVCYSRRGRVRPGAVRTFWLNPETGRWAAEEQPREIQRPLFGELDASD